MAQSYTSDRAVFEKGRQAEYILICKNSLKVTWIKLAKMLGVNSRTLQDWYREKNRMSHSSAIFLSKKTSIALPSNVTMMKWSDHLKLISSKGGKTQYLKNGSIGNETNRKRAWQNWWNKEGKSKKQKIFKRKDIKIPNRDTNLAEFVGIMIGDGSLTKYTLKITLDTLEDKKYILYVTSLIEMLFAVKSVFYIHPNSRATDIIVQSSNLVDFCNRLGLKVGHKIKQKADIPDWIKDHKDLSIACIRGLFDTDGCVFKHSYKINGKEYGYIKIAFTNRCNLVLKSVREILKNLGIRARVSNDGNDIRIENQEDVAKYISIVGTNNSKFKDKINWKRVGVV